jgi:hypothetical protein
MTRCKGGPRAQRNADAIRHRDALPVVRRIAALPTTAALLTNFLVDELEEISLQPPRQDTYLHYNTVPLHVHVLAIRAIVMKRSFGMVTSA